MGLHPATFTRLRPLRALAAACLRLSGWRIEGQLPELPRYVVIGAPHTSNWDFALMLAMALHFRVEFVWMGKDSLFASPLGGLFRWLGGVPVDRSRPHGLVDAAVAAFDARERLVLVIAPEGTRKQVQRWRTGFYHIAAQAGVPILLAYVDARRRVGGLGPLFHPTGDAQADMAAIRAFYAPYDA
ncbi:1-acyl-sn-glycerol-3-phosphate acyltransferase [Plasticicumulans lactativorans]|uniref:1-acyl-sn-glycerol-3-phosphate acyltransferase n=1 Tax=Plasticicumulans lactativorans TaxID=1133106 RepID=A0A4R2L1C7_9GAMM|nr:lysophospholipid acyltransferase family protein [Plasticicumulans lactativorans]TCO80244.1 1-acyl-sn-glycerol-3-phosphate acyltransferase [Plasticicumulans lactativorans]